MNNNDVLRRIRYIFDLDDSKMIATFGKANLTVTRAEISDWLKKDDDEAFQACTDQQLATFLNGFIVEKRGKKDGPMPEPEKRLTNNIILTKLKIALNLQAEDMLEMLAMTEMKISPHELSAFFRKPAHKHYRTCKDQILRNLLRGMQMRIVDKIEPKEPIERPAPKPKPAAKAEPKKAPAKKPSTFKWGKTTPTQD
jgi:uncharacterized protein YehS (DUF1456 family)